MEGELAGLNADKQALADEVAELKDQLQNNGIAKELNWRNAYEAEMSSKGFVRARTLFRPKSKASGRLLGLARARYGDRLAIRLNKKSDPDYGYTRPKEVWDAP